MMGEDYWIDLGRRAVACEGWRWMPGMLGFSGDAWLGAERLAWMDEAGRWNRYTNDGCRLRGVGEGLLLVPDLRDPATVGCLLALVRGAWGDKWAHASQGGVDWWEACCEPSVSDWHTFSGKTEAEALVRALENAPRKEGE